MKVLIAQPIYEKDIAQLETEIHKNQAVDIVLFLKGDTILWKKLMKIT